MLIMWYPADEVELMYDWSQIKNSTAEGGAVWRFMPSGTQLRNGATKDVVEKMKYFIQHMLTTLTRKMLIVPVEEIKERWSYL